MQQRMSGFVHKEVCALLHCGGSMQKRINDSFRERRDECLIQNEEEQQRTIGFGLKNELLRASHVCGLRKGEGSCWR